MYQYRNVLVRMRQGDSDRDIARSKTMGRKKLAQVREIASEHGWLAPEFPLPDDGVLFSLFGRKEALPATCISTLEPWREQVTKWHAAGIQGSTIHAALVRNHGYTGSYSSMYRFLGQLVALQQPDVPMRLTFKPGEAVQVDFGSGPLITDVYTGEIFKTWFFVMTLCWSRHQYAEFVRDQTVATWLGCHRRAFESFSGVPSRVIIDNAKCAITKACVYEPDVQRAYAECAEGYAFKIDPCPPRDPQKKGIVEAGVKYIKGSFLPLREFRDLDDANRQLQAWVMSDAGNRIHGTTREAPLKRFAEVEKGLLNALPSVPPELASWAKVKVHRDAHVQYETNTMVTLFREHETVASHVRLMGKGLRDTVTDHMPPEAQAWQMQDTQWCLKSALQIGPACHALVHALFGDHVLIKMRAVQGVLRLKQKYGSARLEAACSRANHYGTPGYKVVKTILEKGLDQLTPLAAFDALATPYTQGGRFCRDTQTILQ